MPCPNLEACRRSRPLKATGWRAWLPSASTSDRSNESGSTLSLSASATPRRSITADESASRFSAIGPRDAGAMLDPPGSAGVGIVLRAVAA